MGLKHLGESGVRHRHEECNQLKANAIGLFSLAVFLSVAEHNGKGETGEHDGVHYLVRSEPFPKCLDFRNTRPRQTAEYHDDDTAYQAGVDMSCQTFQLSDEGFVTFCVEEVVHLGGVGHFDFDNPAFAVRVGVDFLRSVGKFLVEFDDFAAHWHEHL